MAVSRRQKENDTFTDIALTLPIEESAKELDKASVLRIAIHYLKLRDVLTDCKPSISDGTEEDGADDKAILQSVLPNYTKDVLQALDGFMLMLSKDGRILYATESISHFLGLRQVDVIGVHAQDIIHPQDYQEVNAIFQSQGRDVLEMDALGKDPMRRNFVARMRCAFTPSVRSITRCSNFKPIYCSAFLKFSSKKIKEGEFLGIVVLCKLASVMKIRELCVGAFFKTKHALDLSYTAVDTRIRWILGFDPAEMIGLKAYEYFHHEDLDATSSCHTHLLTKGYSHSCCYRFLSRSGDWVWVRSKSNVCYDPVTHLPNGLNIYTWIVRYEEEDERMKAILCGEDPGRLGVKEIDTRSGVSSGVCGNIAELCSTRSKPMPSSDRPLSQTSAQQQSASAASTPVTSPPMYQPSPAIVNGSPVSPELVAVPPPNVNPFQTPPAPSPMGTQLPLGVQASQPTPTCMQSPPYTPYETGPVASHIQPWQSSKQHYSSTSSSLGPHGSPPREMSPPYSANSTNSVVYNYPTPSASPGSGSVQGNQAFSPGSATELPSSYQHMSQQSSPPMMYSDGVFSPYSASSAQSFGQPMNGFPAPSPFESMPGMAAVASYSAPTHQHHHVVHTQIKQEPRLEAVAAVSHMPLTSQGQGYVYQAKARYAKVAVAGMGRHSSESRHHHLHQLPQPQSQAFPADPIQGITQWLQDSPAAVY